MRKAIFLLLVFALSNTLWAADPIIGTWVMNVDKSDSTVPPQFQGLFLPKKAIETYKGIEGELFEFTTNLILADGSSRSSKWTFPLIGGKVTRLLPEPLPEGRSYIYTKLKPGEWIVTVMENNIQIGVIHKLVSKDSKTMKETRLEMDSQGNAVEFVMIYGRK